MTASAGSIEKAVKDLGLKVADLEGKVSSLTSQKTNLEKDIVDARRRKEQAEKERDDIEGTVKKSIEIAFEKERERINNILADAEHKKKEAEDILKNAREIKKRAEDSLKLADVRHEALSEGIQKNLNEEARLVRRSNKLKSLANTILENVNAADE